MTSRNRDRDRDRDRAAAEALVRRRSVSGDTRLTLSTRAGHAAAAATVAASPTATVRTVTQERLGPAGHNPVVVGHRRGRRARHCPAGRRGCSAGGRRDDAAAASKTRALSAPRRGTETGLQSTPARHRGGFRRDPGLGLGVANETAHVSRA